MLAYYVTIFLKGTAKGLFFPIWILHISNNKISLFFIGILGTILETVRFITEIPLGAFADKYGRKVSLFLSAFLYFMAFFLFSLGNTIYMFVFSVLIMGLADSFESGALEAWLADHLILKGKVDKLENELRKMYIILIAGSIIGAIFITHLYKMNTIMPFLVSAVLYLIATLITCIFVPESLPVSRSSNINKSIINKIKLSVSYVMSSKTLLLLSLAMFLFAIGFDGIERFYQTYLKYRKFNVFWISNIYIISAIFGLAFMFLQNMLINNKKNDLLIIGNLKISMFIILTVAIFINLNIISYLCLVSFFVLEVILRPYLQSYLNKFIDSEIRATTLSFFQFAEACGEILAGIGIGYFIKVLGISYGLFVSAVFILISGLAVFVLLFFERIY
ncbi:putative MFS family arabinose efflux permease [Caldicellulosiruptor bescii]|uniref:Major facilitator superfamily MFS_1 n=3 Tax=Caldicellulosiruptor bescii TaxID=31899 RepID=B9MQR1_CALBD|nr:MFS transporter [Caldicellulosiruptor bescii]ACM60015.1 major facilitator superfamily MFS_1 [Caldicellulosiruptor bescii DSM 6725]PBC87435.1 putative MFS family arabinose efflux permease [Caldicellulosiruptor bescii]PBC90368.1 putative MFS family arabinose efflux permease [Caldicellulosiruptor bescii]PBD04200.1 putative MFS family arabinose efflux permease [Caldicellulosiruptor bescii]PBD06165.1 putative MFS family arabinose efflux permease [Caldicellulosiruptor bescii]